MTTFNKRILIVEDEKKRNLLAIHEVEKKYKVDVAISIEGARNYLKHYSYDLVILDVMMPPSPYSAEETNGGLETGWFFYNKELRHKNLNIIVWTSAYRDIQDKDWGKKVVVKEKLLENDQMVRVVDNYFSSK